MLGVPAAKEAVGHYKAGSDIIRQAKEAGVDPKTGEVLPKATEKEVPRGTEKDYGVSTEEAVESDRLSFINRYGYDKSKHPDTGRPLEPWEEQKNAEADRMVSEINKTHDTGHAVEDRTKRYETVKKEDMPPPSRFSVAKLKIKQLADYMLQRAKEIQRRYIVGKHLGDMQEINVELTKKARDLQARHTPDWWEAMTVYREAGGNRNTIKKWLADTKDEKLRQGYQDAFDSF